MLCEMTQAFVALNKSMNVGVPCIPSQMVIVIITIKKLYIVLMVMIISLMMIVITLVLIGTQNPTYCRCYFNHSS